MINLGENIISIIWEYFDICHWGNILKSCVYLRTFMNMKYKEVYTLHMEEKRDFIYEYYPLKIIDVFGGIKRFMMYPFICPGKINKKQILSIHEEILLEISLEDLVEPVTIGIDYFNKPFIIFCTLVENEPHGDIFYKENSGLWCNKKIKKTRSLIPYNDFYFLGKELNRWYKGADNYVLKNIKKIMNGKKCKIVKLYKNKEKEVTAVLGIPHLLCYARKLYRNKFLII